MENNLKTKEQIAKEILAKNRKGSYEDWINNICEGLEEYRKQGRYFTVDEIINIESLAYENGFITGLSGS